MGFGLALHEVIVVGFASCTDKVCGAHQRRRAGADLLDWWYGVWERGGVDEDFLVEAVVGRMIRGGRQCRNLNSSHLHGLARRHCENLLLGASIKDC